MCFLIIIEHGHIKPFLGFDTVWGFMFEVLCEKRLDMVVLDLIVDRSALSMKFDYTVNILSRQLAFGVVFMSEWVCMYIVLYIITCMCIFQADWISFFSVMACLGPLVASHAVLEVNIFYTQIIHPKQSIEADFSSIRCRFRWIWGIDKLVCLHIINWSSYLFPNMYENGVCAVWRVPCQTTLQKQQHNSFNVLFHNCFKSWTTWVFRHFHGSNDANKQRPTPVLRVWQTPILKVSRSRGDFQNNTNNLRMHTKQHAPIDISKNVQQTINEGPLPTEAWLTDLYMFPPRECVGRFPWHQYWVQKASWLIFLMNLQNA